MPLHLLGKKLWNVYNTDNIARVRKDEAAAQAKEEEQERRWREDDASNRLKVLRGEEIPLTTEEHPHVESVPSREHGGVKRKRRIAGEDDTDREIRLAREDMRESEEQVQREIRGSADPPKIQRDKQQNSMKDEKEVEVQGMRFKDAAGFKQENRNPWYVGVDLGAPHPPENVSRDVWGNEDPRRREREQQRVSASDPLLAMKRGVRKLRENEKEKKEWIEQRERDMYEVEELAKAKRDRRRLPRERDEDDLDDFRLDDRRRSQHDRHDKDRMPGSKHQQSRQHHPHRRHRSASPSKEDRHHRTTKHSRHAKRGES